MYIKNYKSRKGKQYLILLNAYHLLLTVISALHVLSY